MKIYLQIQKEMKKTQLSCKRDKDEELIELTVFKDNSVKQKEKKEK